MVLSRTVGVVAGDHDDHAVADEGDWRYLTRKNPPRAARATPRPRRRRPPSLPARPRCGKCLRNIRVGVRRHHLRHEQDVRH